MAGSKSLYLENAVLDLVLGAVLWTPPSIIYVALSSAAYDDAAASAAFNELAGAGYARAAVNNDTTSWPVASNGQKSNGVTITFATATGAWLPIVSAYLLDAVSGGNILYGGDLANQRTLQAGDTASFGPGGITVNEN